jgi:hypothetical protein
MLIMGVAAGFVWELFATPAVWEVHDTGLMMDEAGSKGQFSVIVVFVLVGAVASLILGLFTGWAARDLEWKLTPFVILLTVAASLIAWRLGVRLGPPDPSSVQDVSVGDRIPDRLAVNGFAAFVVWPVFGLLGLIGATLIAAARDPFDESQHSHLGNHPYS